MLAGVVLVNVVGAAPAIIAGPDSAWFRSLAKPAIYPPGWAFGVVWTLLFTLMGVAVALVWLDGRGTRAGRVALALFAVQMVLNVDRRAALLLVPYLAWVTFAAVLNYQFYVLN
ncbi:hypothetical protein BRC74_02035 [Halobacteriales archaeon QH_7_68_42]|nr:MAG: hypothetical protein BRC74_02035 [Halobacteriales archaeon QH_7_68_42]